MKQLSKLFFISLVLLSSCQESNKATIAKPSEQVALSLHVSSVSSQYVPRHYSATGYTNISQSIEISTSQASTIKKLNVDEGDTVKAGTLLIELDESELLASIKQAESSIKTAKVNLKDSKHDFDTAKRLIQSKVIPAQQFRKAKVQLDLVRSQLEQAQSKLKSSKPENPIIA